MITTWAVNADQPFKVLRPESTVDLLTWLPQLQEGWSALHEEALIDVPYDGFVFRLMQAVLARSDMAAVFIYVSKHDKFLGFTIVEDNSPTTKRQTLLVYAAYSNGKYKGAANASLVFVGNWARLVGYKKLQLYSQRMSGSAMRLFRKKLNFTPVGVTFEKTL